MLSSWIFINRKSLILIMIAIACCIAFVGEFIIPEASGPGSTLIELRLFFYYEYIPALYYYNENVYVLYDPDVSGGGYAKRGEERTELPFVGTIDARCAAYNGRKTTARRYDGLPMPELSGLPITAHISRSAVFLRQGMRTGARSTAIFLSMSAWSRTIPR